MLHLNFREVVEAVKGEILIPGDFNKVNHVGTDTRTVEDGDIFIALKGEKFNGNEYIKEAINKGAVMCIVDEMKFDPKELGRKTAVIKVSDTRRALLELAKYYRSRLSVKVIGITGSTGKTSTKDLIASGLSSRYRVFKTKGNFNNEIGLPLMIFKIDDSYDVAVLEMGMSNLGEIHRLADVARPDIAVITNIGVSHLENLHTRENILKAKMEITDFFTENCTLILNCDNDLLKNVNSNIYKVIRTGIDNPCEYKALDIDLGEGFIGYRVQHNSEAISGYFRIEIPGKHNILNSLLAIACGRTLKMTYEEIMEGFNSLEFTSMRLDIVKGKLFTIIDDSYNASPDSMMAAIDVLASQRGKRKIAVLGTMKELGSNSYEFHKSIGKHAKAKNVDLLITVGEFSKAFEEGYESPMSFKSFSNVTEACSFFENEVHEDDVILVKASRSMKFETIVNELKKINR